MCGKVFCEAPFWKEEEPEIQELLEREWVVLYVSGHHKS